MFLKYVFFFSLVSLPPLNLQNFSSASKTQIHTGASFPGPTRGPTTLLASRCTRTGTRRRLAGVLSGRERKRKKRKEGGPFSNFSTKKTKKNSTKFQKNRPRGRPSRRSSTRRSTTWKRPTRPPRRRGLARGTARRSRRCEKEEEEKLKRGGGPSFSFLFFEFFLRRVFVSPPSSVSFCFPRTAAHLAFFPLPPCNHVECPHF